MAKSPLDRFVSALWGQRDRCMLTWCGWQGENGRLEECEIAPRRSIRALLVEEVLQTVARILYACQIRGRGTKNPRMIMGWCLVDGPAKV